MLAADIHVIAFQSAFGLRPLQTDTSILFAANGGMFQSRVRAQAASDQSYHCIIGVVWQCFNPAFGLRPLQTLVLNHMSEDIDMFQSRVRAQAASDGSARCNTTRCWGDVSIPRSGSGRFRPGYSYMQSYNDIMFQSRVRAQAASDLPWDRGWRVSSRVSIPRSGSGRFRPTLSRCMAASPIGFNPAFGLRPLQTATVGSWSALMVRFQSRVRAQAASDMRYPSISRSLG